MNDDDDKLTPDNGIAVHGSWMDCGWATLVLAGGWQRVRKASCASRPQGERERDGEDANRDEQVLVFPAIIFEPRKRACRRLGGCGELQPLT